MSRFEIEGGKEELAVEGEMPVRPTGPKRIDIDKDAGGESQWSEASSMIFEKGD